MDKQFLVPHGSLDDEEGGKDENESLMSPSASKKHLKMKEKQFEPELMNVPYQTKLNWLLLVSWFKPWTTALESYLTPLWSFLLLFLSDLISSCVKIGNHQWQMIPIKVRRHQSDRWAKVKYQPSSAYSMETCKIAIIKEFHHYLERNRIEENKNSTIDLFSRNHFNFIAM